MNTSHQRDRDVKMPVYAATGIRELWLIDMDTRKSECLRNSDTTNRVYQTRRIVDFEDMLIPAALEQVFVKLAAL